ncbi:MAG: DUF21 domain-containing protein [Halobacteriales archaeon]|nr:DUF21 domain-containing protein [Halobacteriales archaeon]
MAFETLVTVGVGATIGLLVLSAFFSSSETAIFSLPVSWIDEQAATGEPRAKLLQGLRNDPHRLLVTLLVGNNVVNVAISSIVTVLLTRMLPTGTAVVAATILVSVVVLIFGEIVPKSVGLGNAQSWALTVAKPVRLTEQALSPIVTVMDAVTRWIGGHLSGDVHIEEHLLD